MKKMNEKDIVNNQYKDTSNLDIRIMIHKKYSTNKMGFANWIFLLCYIWRKYNFIKYS